MSRKKAIALAYAVGVLLTAFAASSASGQTIAGCGPTDISKAEADNATALVTNADCFGKAKAVATTAEQVRRDRIKALPPVQGWVNCVEEGGSCTVPANTQVRYGAAGKFVTRVLSGKFTCSNATFGGDPIVGTVKACATQGAVAPSPSSGKTDGLGINVASVDYYSNEATFANILTGSSWVDTNAGWQTVPADQIDNLGMPLSVPATKSYAIVMTPPAGVFAGETVTVRCTWSGSGSVGIGGNRKNLKTGDHSLTFDWPAGPPPEGNTRSWISISNVPAGDPLKALDCRNASLARDAVFEPQLLDSLKPFKALRFLDWSAANQNPPKVTWGSRTLPGSVAQADRRRDGVALENMIALANQTDTDPWLTLPWNADANYYTRAAQLVYDTLDKGHRVYVEVGNENWNYAFPLSHQIQAEGLAAGLDTNGFGANLKRYSQKTIEVMAIWAKVFADRPQALVRVASTQASNSWVGEQVLAYPGLVANIDALAIAPYFQYDKAEAATLPLADRMASVRRAVDNSLNDIAKYKVLADKAKVRLITYEAGQHVTDFTAGGGTRVQEVNRSPLMYDAYRAYIAGWQNKTGDLMVLYSATGPAGGGGAWGIREYAGQPLAETPKRAAVLDAAGK